MTKKIFVLLLGIILFANFASAAADIAYILEDASKTSQNIIDALNELGLTYEVVKDSQISSKDFSQYSVLLIVEDVTNLGKLPFGEVHSFFFDEEVAETVWQGSEGSFTSNQKTVKVYLENHEIFDGVLIPSNGEIDVYTGYLELKCII